MINPFKRAAELARQDADAVRANPHLADVAEDDYARAAEVRRLAVIADRTRKVREAQEKADNLAARAERLDQAVTDHEAAVQRERPRMTTARKALAGSDAAVVAAVRKVDTALGELYDAAHTRNQLVEQTSRELRAAGLAAAYQDGDAVVGFQDGGNADGVTLGGKWWVPVSPTGLLRRGLYGALRARLGVQATEGMWYRHVQPIEQQSGDLLAAAPLPPAHVPPPDDWHREIAEAHAHLRERLQPSEQRMRDDELDRRREAHQDRERDLTARREYAKHRAEMVRHKGEDYVVALEHRLFRDGVVFPNPVPEPVR